MFSSNRNEFFWLSVALLFGTLLFGWAAKPEAQTATEYGSSAPKIEADRVLSFTWDDVDKYPVITTLAFVPGEPKLLSGGDDCRLSVWNLENGVLESHALAHDDWIRGMAMGPDGSVFATVSQDGTVKLWKTADVSVQNVFSEKRAGSQGIAFSPDGKRVAVCGFDDSVALFEIPSGTLAGKWRLPATGNTVIRYSPDGRFLAAAGRNGVVRVWNTPSMKVAVDLPTSGRRIFDVEFSPDSRFLAAGGEDSAITVWDVASGRVSRSLSTNVGKTFSLCFCGNQRLASGDSLNTIRLWNLENGTEQGRGFGHTGTIAVLKYDAPTETLVSAGFDTTVRFWPLPPVR